MAYYSSFPATYQPMYSTPYQAQQMPVYAPQVPQAGYQGQSLPGTQMSQANQQPPQMLTPPTIRAEIIQIEDEAAVDKFPLGPGSSQMFITKSEDKVIIKTMGQDGPLPLIIYDKRPPEPPAPKFDPALFVRKDELETLVSAAMAAQMHEKDAGAAQVAPKRAAKKEAE